MGISDTMGKKLGITQHLNEITSLPTNIWNSLMHRYKFSDYLCYMSYDPQRGIYQNNDNSYGAIFICAPRIRMGESTATSIEELMNKLPENIFLQFSLFGSKNIRYLIDYWKDMHMKRAEVEDNELLRKAVSNMGDFYFTKTKASISQTMTTKLKDHLLLVSIKSDSEQLIVDFQSQLRNILTSNHFAPQICPPDVLKSMCWEIFNGNHNINEIPPYDPACYINRQLITPSTSIFVKDSHIELDNRSYISLVPQNFPQQAHISDFGEKLGDYISRALDNNQFKDTFLITSSICKLPKSKTERVKNNHKILTTQKWPENLFRNFAAARKESVGILDRIDNSKEQLFAFDLNVLVSGDSYEEASLNAQAIISYWNKGGGKSLLLDEALGIHQLNLIASLPMGINKEYVYDITAKYRSFFPDQISQFIPLEADFKGSVPNLLLFSRRGQIAGLDLFVSNSNYNAYLVATSGAGKSVLLNMIGFNSYARGDRVFVLDYDNSFLKLCEVMNGQYVFLDPHKPISFNPFSDIKSEAQLMDDLEYLSSFMYMLGSNKNEDESKRHEKLIKTTMHELIQEIYKEKGSSMEITDLRDALLQIDNDGRFTDFAKQMGAFCRGGVYEAFLMGPNQFNIAKEFIVVEFKGIEDHPDLRDPLIMLLVYHINQLMYQSTDRKARIQIIIDEAHRFLGKNPKMDDFIEQAYRRARKYAFSTSNYAFGTSKVDKSRLAGCQVVNSKGTGLDKERILNIIAGPLFSLTTEKMTVLMSKSGFKNGSYVYEALSLEGDSENDPDCQIANWQDRPTPPSKDDNLEQKGRDKFDTDKRDTATSVSAAFNASHANNNTVADEAFNQQVANKVATADARTKVNSFSDNMVDFDYANSQNAVKQAKMIQDDELKQQYCEVNKPIKDSAGFSDTNTRKDTADVGGQFIADTGWNTSLSGKADTMNVVEMRECKNEPMGSDNFVCPVNKAAGETIRQPCGSVDCPLNELDKCNKDLIEFLTIFTAVDEAAGDMTCSTE